MAHDIFPQDDEFNRSLTNKILSISDLAIYVRFCFLDYRNASEKAGISYGRVKQILTGKFLPKSPRLIKKIAKGWGVESIILTQLFDRERQRGVNANS